MQKHKETTPSFKTIMDRVKVHVFYPSGRKVWTVVGRDDEYWTDPELEFCSCKSFYYKSLSGGQPCYHIKMTLMAKQYDKFPTIIFDDTEYTSFIGALISDSAKNLLL
jgi:predicted nucleic acid-binding Zn finger protein